MRSRLRRMSLRWRLMGIGLAGVAMALAVGSLTLYAVLSLALDRALDSTARASAADVATLVDRDALPDPIPVSGVQVVQVLDSRSRVLAGSVNADRLTPLLRPPELSDALAGDPVRVPGARAGVDGPLRVLAVQAGRTSDPRSVVVAVPLGDVEHSKQVLRTTLLLTYPLLLAVLGLIAWRVIGSALAPVETLRAGAERISGAGQSERLPVPESVDEVHRLAVTLNSMLDRMAASRARQRSFVADAAHELRSPLASMRTQLEVAQRLRDGSRPADKLPSTLPSELTSELTSELSDDLLADLARLTRLVEDLLLLSRADADAPPLAATADVDVAALLESVAARHTGSRVPVTVSAPPGCVVRAAPAELERAVANLVDNAVRHAASGVRLESRALPGSGGCPVVEVAVVDDGPGIAEADRERVFDRFTRLDDARDRDAGGSGLGLAITRELVRRAGGTITLAQAQPPGLSAEIRLPGVSPTDGGRQPHSRVA